jgi:hypothetical protein
MNTTSRAFGAQKRLTRVVAGSVLGAAIAGYALVGLTPHLEAGSSGMFADNPATYLAAGTDRCYRHTYYCRPVFRP